MESIMKPTLALISLFISLTATANCEKELTRAKNDNSPNLIITFDGLGTAEFGMKVLERRFVGLAQKKCSKKLISANFYYSKNGAKKAIKCAQSFADTFGSRFSLSVVGHSFGAGKGVMNFIEQAEDTTLYIENTITFDARGYSYKYSAPAKSVSGNFINIYQKIPLAGQKVKGADHEFDVTGKTSHVGLPKDFSKLALDYTEGALYCR